MVDTYRLADNLSLIDVDPPIRGFGQFIGIYVLQAREIALIDIGPTVSVANLVSGLKELNISPSDVSYIFVTHIHVDHAGGVGRALQQMPEAKVVVQERGGPHLIDPTRLWEDSLRALGELAEQYEPMEPVPAGQVIIGKDGMSFDLGGVELEVLETPGHASHHLSFWNRREGRLFAGEAASVYTESAGLIRPGTPTPFNLEQAVNSMDRLIQLAPATMCYAHFGCIGQPLDNMRRAREQLILWGKTVVGCLEREASHEDMYRALRERDDMLARLDNLPEDKRDRELYFINNSINGLVSYFKRFGTEYVKQL